jgi:hypothetical protein
MFNTLSGDSTLVGLLATFASAPAVFINTEAPDDSDFAWGTAHYPFVLVWIDRNYTQGGERKVQGTITVDIVTRDEAGSDPEPIANRVVQLLDGTIYHPDNEPVLQLTVARNERFKRPDQLIVGETLTFNMLGFPAQTTYSPDPVAGINTLLAQQAGIQVDPVTWSGNTATTPAVYTEFEGIERETWVGPDGSILWDARFRLHVLAPDPTTTLYWVRKLAELIKTTRRGRVLLDNDDDLLVNDVRVVQSRDPMRTGQVQIQGEFGTVGVLALGPPVASKILTHVIIPNLYRRRYAQIRLVVR